jgi:hypothetical protein
MTTCIIADSHSDLSLLGIVGQHDVARRAPEFALAILLKDVLVVGRSGDGFFNVKIGLHHGGDERIHNLKPIATVGP